MKKVRGKVMTKNNFELSQTISLKIGKILHGLDLNVSAVIILTLISDVFMQIKKNTTASEYEEYKKDFINKLFDAEFIKKMEKK